MKSLSLLLTLVFFGWTLTLNAQNAKAKATDDKAKAKNKAAMKSGGAASMELPYTAMYSSRFEIGDPKYSAIVLNAWKGYDDNTMDNNDFIADTVSATLPDGTVLKGKDSFINAMKTLRNSFASAKSEVVAYMPVRSIDKGDDIVFIWGTETDTKTDGTTQKVDIHEVWAFNKDGKLSFFKQFAGQTPNENKK